MYSVYSTDKAYVLWCKENLKDIEIPEALFEELENSGGIKKQFSEEIVINESNIDLIINKIIDHIKQIDSSIESEYSSNVKIEIDYEDNSTREKFTLIL